MGLFKLPIDTGRLRSSIGVDPAKPDEQDVTVTVKINRKSPPVVVCVPAPALAGEPPFSCGNLHPVIARTLRVAVRISGLDFARCKVTVDHDAYQDAYIAKAVEWDAFGLSAEQASKAMRKFSAALSAKLDRELLEKVTKGVVAELTEHPNCRCE